MTERKDIVERLDEMERQLDALNWREPVPDDLQSDIRMEFNEALAGGPNMNGDAGPTLTVSHARDCIWATRRIERLQAENAALAVDAETYRQMHEDATGLGYESILEALEDLERLKTSAGQSA